MDNRYHVGSGEYTTLYIQDQCPSGLQFDIKYGATLFAVILCVADKVPDTLVIKAAGSAQVTVLFVIAGAGSHACDIQTVCVDSGAYINVKVLYLLDSQQMLNVSVDQQHMVPASASHCVAHGVLRDAARADIAGLITIGRSGSNTDASFYTKTMLLSDDARVSTQPQLEVSTNDVRCAHGAAAGYPDKHQVYYLMSRGLSYRQAQSMIVRGFISEMLVDLPSTFRDSMWRLCENKLLY